MTRLTGHCTVSWQDVVVDTLHKARPFNYTYCNIQPQDMAAELKCVMIHQAMPTVALYWQGLPRQAGWRRETGGKRKLPVPEHWRILGVEPISYFVKHILFLIAKRSLGYVDIYQENFKGKKLGYKIGTWNVRTVLKGEHSSDLQKSCWIIKVAAIQETRWTGGD